MAKRSTNAKPDFDPRLAVDRRALSTLQQQGRYESSTYTGDSVEAPSADEIAYARAAGYFWDDFESTHDAMIERLLAAKDRLTPRRVADAFVAGVGKRRPDWRSAIASYAVAMHFPRHKADLSEPNFRCLVCEEGDYSVRDPDGRYNVSPNWVAQLRFDLGGGAFNQTIPNFAAIDLEQFESLSVHPTPDAADIDQLRLLLKVLRGFDSTINLTKARKAIAALGGANEMQRQQTIETLSTIGILKPAKCETFLTGFTPYTDRIFPGGKNDWAFPAIAWHGRDGVNEDAIRFWFGHLL